MAARLSLSSFFKSFKPCWHGNLTDYVTAIAWSPSQPILAMGSAAGEVNLYEGQTGRVQALEPATGQAIHGLAYSADGWLAAGGAAGQVKLWRSPGTEAEQLPVTTRGWIDHLAWSPTQPHLAYSVGRSVQVWDAAARRLVATLNFGNSAVLHLTWHPTGDRLTVSGYRGIKVWTAADWADDPYLLTIPAACVATAWSPDGRYIASGNLDRTITVLEWHQPQPWVMRGFPEKVRQLAWASSPTGAPQLAVASGDSLTLWDPHPDPAIGWVGQVLSEAAGSVRAMQFQPGTRLLAATAAKQVDLWLDGDVHSLGKLATGVTSLAWHPQGQWLAAGSEDGEIRVWQHPPERSLNSMPQPSGSFL